MLRARHAAQLPAPRKEAVLLETALFAAMQAQSCPNPKPHPTLSLTHTSTLNSSPPCMQDAMQRPHTHSLLLMRRHGIRLWCLP